MSTGHSSRAPARLLGDHGPCSTCGKLRFSTRKDARRAARKGFPGEPRLTAYRCGDYWHFGHNRWVVVAGYSEHRDGGGRP